ncbi:hypothetical protein [Photobacterium galatheae]|uniref:Uncharacterized protein n=1 Tax=Photobacterium galatheae TaxID=1654360 RepID=A0A066RPF9_9GAMM|nr:hypothetical protein [Photobacterium galatheae]KDM91006.1 hypothetical protein EA58_14745 [Photobacterium galatheae]MCM0149040.1 hypothetical protein [Photobacterium galatheae]
MSILFRNASSGKEFIINNLDLDKVEVTFADGFRKKHLLSLASMSAESGSFSEQFFDKKRDDHALIAKVAFENHSVFNRSDLLSIERAILELEGIKDDVQGIYGIFKDAQETLNTQQVAIFETDITY